MLRKSCLTLLLLLPILAHANEQDWFFKPYIGADVGTQGMPFEPQFGEGHFKANSPYTNFNLGVWLHQYLGLEMGYARSYAQQHQQFYNSGDKVLGNINTIDVDDKLYFSEVGKKGWNLNVLGAYPILEKTTLLVSAGTAWSKMNFNTNFIKDDVVNRATFGASERKAVLRLGLGVRQMITENFGVRLMYHWENSNRLNTAVAPEPEFPQVFYKVKPKNSHLLYLGFFYQGHFA